MKKIVLFFLASFAAFFANAQTVKLLTSGTRTSIRGLSVVNDKVIWVSGSGGMIGKSVDSGNTFRWMTVPGFSKTEFRDIEAFDSSTAIIMAIDTPATILKTKDGGKTWVTTYRNTQKGMFLDAMEFWNEQSGIVIGDPIDGKFFIARTFDGGNKWQPVPFNNLPLADSGEACFASSGTNIRKLNKKEAVFVSGGLSSHIFIKDKKILLPLLQGKESTGANSVAVKNKNMFIAVGGDFNTKDSTEKNCIISVNGGTSFTEPQTKPHGYRSCIEYVSGKTWITCGLSGVDISEDDGNNFRLISKDSFHVCRKAKKGKAVFFAGGNGRIGKLIN
jgi:hypothetical protein